MQDPLHEILEKHLIKSSFESSSAEMIDKVVAEYLEFYQSKGIHIPAALKEGFIEDVRYEVRKLTIKKTYGAVIPQGDDEVAEPKINIKPV